MARQAGADILAGENSGQDGEEERADHEPENSPEHHEIRTPACAAADIHDPLQQHADADASTDADDAPEDQTEKGRESDTHGFVLKLNLFAEGIAPIRGRACVHSHAVLV